MNAFAKALRPSALPIRAQLALLALACTLPLAAIIGWELAHEVGRAAAAETSPAQLAADARARELDARVDGLRTFAEAAAVAVRPALERGDRAAIAAVLASLKPVLLGGATEIGLHDARGDFVASTLATSTDAPLADRPWFRAALAGKDLVASEPLDSRLSGRRVVVFARSIRDALGQPLAVLHFAFTLPRLAAIAHEEHASGARGWIEFTSGEIASARPVAEDAGPVARARSRTTPWTLAASAPGSGAWAVLATKLALAASGLALAFAGAAAIYRGLARPLEQLGQALAACGAGRGAVRMPLTGGGELRQLAASFNAMAADLDASRRRFEAVVRAASDWTWETDDEARFTVVRNTAEPGFAVREHHFVGRFILDLVEPDDPAAFDALRVLVEARAPFRNVRVRRQAPGGSVYLDIAGEPMNGTDGAFLGYMGSARDVTGLVLAERRLRHERQRFEEMVEAMHEGVVIVDRDGRFAFVNSAAEAVMRLPRGSVLGTFAAAAPWSRRREDGAEVRSEELVQNRVFATGARASTRMQYFRPDGSQVWLELRGAPLRDASGAIEAVLVTLFDVTRQREAQERLARSNAELESRVQQRTLELTRHVSELHELTYVVSHDLRAPLRAIDGFATILSTEAQVERTAESESLLARIGQNARHMGSMVDALLDYASIGRAPLARRAVSMDAALGHARRDLAELIGRSGTRIDFDTLGVHVADAEMVRTLFRVLLENAVRFAHPDRAPRVHVEEVALAEGRAWRVSDNGMGFDMRFAGQLFRVFQRLGEEGGLGIGLATARRIVELHGGVIFAQGVPGEGAAFTFTLGRPEA